MISTGKVSKKRKIILILATALLVVVGIPFGIFRLFLNLEVKTLNEVTRSEIGGTYAALSEGTVSYELAGSADGPLLVFIPGFSVPSYVWDKVISPLNDLGYRTLRFDLYGRGYSDRPDIDYDIPDYIRQTEELLNALDIRETFTVVALSMGGPIGADYAVNHLDRVENLVLINPLYEPLSATINFIMEIPVISSLLNAFYLVPAKYPSVKFQGLYNDEQYTSWTDQFAEQMHYRGFRHAMLISTRNLDKNRLPIYEAVKESGIPVMLILGENDTKIPYEKARESLLPALGDGIRLEIISECGHIPVYEQPDEVVRLLDDYLGTGD